MDVLTYLINGFTVSLSLANVWYCFVGCLVGTAIGVLPGLGPTATIALLFPLTFNLDPVAAIIMLSGIYYGAMYGGSTTSILVNIPGEAASVVTCLDGYQMARKGRAGAALGISAFGSFIAGTLSVFGLALMAPAVAGFALKFGAPEYFSMIVVGLVAVTCLSQGSMLKSMMMIFLGLFLSTVGNDSITGEPRFQYGLLQLQDGLDFIPLVMGCFGVSEILINLEDVSRREVYTDRISGLLPTLKDWGRSIFPMLRGSTLGFFLGTLPGSGAVLGSFAAYALEKRLSRHPEEFGKGAIEGVAAPEAANNAASQGAFIPLLTLGIPANSVMALLVGALIVHGVQPGPLLMSSSPGIFWGVITSMYLGNFLLLLLNLPLLGLWVRLLKVPYPILFPLILVFCLIGCFSLNYSVFDIGMMGIFGIVGYLLRKLHFELTPLVLAFVLGPLFEDKLRQALLIHHGDLSVLFTRPISAVFLVLALALVLLQLFPALRKIKSAALEESGL
ncbi:MAG: tripartite tricarboxylate transporter permease [Thermodesulfobacteriota bacterium]